jgi:hypothetical protein
MASDGPSLSLRFQVPERLQSQTIQFSSQGGLHEVMACPMPLPQPAALSLTFPAHEALDRLMKQPSPQRPAINQ